MRADKWKSVVISVENYKMLKRLSKRNHRTLSGQFAHILEVYVKQNLREVLELSAEDVYPAEDV